MSTMRTDAREKKLKVHNVFLRFFISIFLTIFIGAFCMQQILNYTVMQTVEKRLDVYYHDLASGPMWLIIKDLENWPQAQWQDRIREMEKHFSFPLKISSLAETQLDTRDILELRAGKIVVRKNGQFYYQRIEDSERVLVMGPVAGLKFGLKEQLAAWSIFVSLVALLTLIWAIPFARKLRHISTTATAFGGGDLSTRASVWKYSSLEPLSTAFNAMAGRIENLISSHVDLTNAVSHELRTPLSRMRFGLEMLQGARDEAERAQYTQGITRDVAELEALVSELLSYARMEREKPELSFTRRALLPWLEEAMLDVEPLLAQVRMGQSVDARATEAPLYFDAFMLSRAVRNLLLNAARHAREQVAVRIERKGDDCLIHVDDDGPGVPLEYREKIFQPFVRVDTSRDRQTGGHGLGLAIVTRIMQWHGGRAFVSDSELGGARFTLQWPGFAAEAVTSEGQSTLPLL